MAASSATLTDRDLVAGVKPAIGDIVILSDFAKCTPRSAISPTSAKGKWWLRPYRTASGGGQMLCVEARDKQYPQTCIAPTLTWPLRLQGVYDIWVGTYRPDFGGGIDIRVSGDKAFTHIDPWEEAFNQANPPAKVGNLGEYLFKTASLDGKRLQIRQPKGTYQSFWWGLCNAHIAYIKLIRRDPAQVAAETARMAKLPRKEVIFDRDGFSYIWLWGTDDIECVLAQVEQLPAAQMSLNWCIGSSMEANFPHPMAGRIVTTERLGDKRATRVYQGFIDRGADILKVLAARCHELGVKLYVSQRANAHYFECKAWNDHPEWRLKSGGGFDYANPEARAWYRDMLLYIAEHYDIDGLTIDFTRQRRHFNPDQADQLQIMNAYLRDVRAGLDRIGKAKGKHLALNASFDCGTWYEDWTPEREGLDVATWVKEGIVDCIMPEGREHMKYLTMCKGTKVRCCPRVTYQMTFDGDAAGANIHDPEPWEDGKDRPDNFHLGPLDLMKGIDKWYKAGADGVMLFNMPEAWTTLRHVAYPQLLAEDLKAGRIYGRREGEAVQWK